MSISRQITEQSLYEFDSSYQICYVNYSRANDLADAQLLITLEKAGERKTFSFIEPVFADIDKNIVTCHGIYIAALKSSPVSPARIEVGDVEGGFPYFTARSMRNITPTA